MDNLNSISFGRALSFNVSAIVTISISVLVLISGCGTSNDTKLIENTSNNSNSTVNNSDNINSDAANNHSINDIGNNTIDAKPAGCGNTEITGSVGQSFAIAIDHNGIERTARIYLPQGYTGDQTMPLLFVLHGGFGSGEQIEQRSADFNPIADQEGFIVIYPDGVEGRAPLNIRTWNGGDCCGYAHTQNIDDVGFIDALLDKIIDEYCIDEDRIYSTGMSNGAIMSYRIACELSDRFAAIAPVAGPMMMPSCNVNRPLPLLHIHGTDDDNVPVDGGQGCGFANVTFPPVGEGLEFWQEINSCQGNNYEYLSQGNGRCDILGDCQKPVVLCMIDQGGHSWPGGQRPVNLARCDGGEHSTSFPASVVIWNFLKEHTLSVD